MDGFPGLGTLFRVDKAQGFAMMITQSAEVRDVFGHLEQIFRSGGLKMTSVRVEDLSETDEQDHAVRSDPFKTGDGVFVLGLDSEAVEEILANCTGAVAEVLEESVDLRVSIQGGTRGFKVMGWNDSMCECIMGAFRACNPVDIMDDSHTRRCRELADVLHRAATRAANASAGGRFRTMRGYVLTKEMAKGNAGTGFTVPGEMALMWGDLEYICPSDFMVALFMDDGDNGGIGALSTTNAPFAHGCNMSARSWSSLLADAHIWASDHSPYGTLWDRYR